MSKKFKIVLLVFVFVLFSLSQSEANWWKRPKLSEEMQLKKENIETFDKIISKNHEEILGIQKEIKKLNTDLMQTLKNNKISKEKKTAALNKTIEKIVKLQGNIISKMYSRRVKILNMLTVKQLDVLTGKYPNILQRRWGGRNIKRPKKIRKKADIKEKADVKK